MKQKFFESETLIGIVFCLAAAIPARILGSLFPIVGGPVFGILIGMIIAFFKRPAKLEKGIKFTSKYILQYSIILLGFEMNLFNVIKVGGQSLLVMLFFLIVVVYAVVTLVSLRNQIADKNAEAAALTSSITAVEQKNGKLEEAIATADSDEGVEAIARDKLGMVTDGEIVFHDVGD